MAGGNPVLALPDFRTFFTARVLAITALQMQAVVVGWQVWKLTGDELMLGLIGLAEAVPAIAGSFVAGHVVDVRRPYAVYGLGLLVQALNSAMLLVAVLPSLALPLEARLAMLYVGVFVSGAARSFTGPAVFTMIPQLVPRSMLPAAAAWNSSTFQLSAIAGPILGGLFYERISLAAAFGVPVALLTAALLRTLQLSAEAKALRSGSRHEPFVQSLRAGIAFSLGHRVLLSTMLLDMFSVLFGGAVAVLPAFADKVFHTDAVGLAVLRAAPSVGALVMAGLLAIRPLKVISGSLLLAVVAGFGLSQVLFGLSTSVAPAVVFLAAAGAFDGVSMVVRSTLLQLLTPDEMRGRVSALSSVFITSSNEIGAFESGVAARALGLVPSVLFGGTMTLVVVALTAVGAPSLRRTAIRVDEGA